ncbi:hypothetical protein GHT06_021876 [Daphnia sinensis]|uniref:Uncharacterized protein n=1 Tax=Daphnia sinensis TaxID=1820382 RepID=A0AAD5KX38_9CRUS|nr:hypothetical protein GHT06_021876 [Daphnia sinensis]
MKLILIALLGLAAIVTSQPVDEAAAPHGVPVEGVAVEAEPIHDMEGSEAGLKFIEHKLEHWLKKCYKKGGCGSGYGYGGYPAYPYPVPVYTPVYTPVYHGVYAAPYGGGYGGSHGLYGGYGSYGGYGDYGYGGYGYGR